MPRPTVPPRPRQRRCGDDGTALVEFTFVAVLLLTMVFAIIQLGLLLSFKQDMTRAAAEGARAGAVASSGRAASAADAATDEAVRGFSSRFSGAGCATAGMTCSPAVVAACSPSTTDQCVTVELSYDYESEPFIVPVPLISALLPDTVEAKSVARINP